ncbi:Extracellular solute-binding protein [Crateriforma conspicua]|uniref:Extracellular solute-binding protein n=1 Tax=Crateriforma conspicua TaxID=2527996 RepID=A0A5C6FUC6_9PLAN|nr:Extracellular solute-binding protein [Crateriforma conspicua]
MIAKHIVWNPASKPTPFPTTDPIGARCRPGATQFTADDHVERIVRRSIEISAGGLRCILLCFLVAGAVSTGVARAAELLNYAQSGSPPDPGLQLLQEEPHDLIFFTQDSGAGWVKARLLDLPNRTSISGQTGTLRVEVLGIDDRVFGAKWSDVERIDFWEQRLKRETAERIARRDFKGAYPFLSVLIRDFPNLPELTQIRSDFLWQDAIDRASRSEFVQSLAMLKELRRYNPDYKVERLLGAIDGLNDRLMGQLVEDGKLDDAQKMLSQLEDEYRGQNLKSVAKWNQAFVRMATQRMDQAIAAKDREDYREAHRLARDAVHLRPSLAGAKELVRELNRIYPMVNVGVLQAARDLDPTNMSNWASRRSGRLLYRTLFEMRGAGPEGGEYEFLFGQTEQSADRLEFDLYFEPESLPPPLNQVNGFDVFDRIADRARPESETYFTAFAAALKTMGMNGPKEIRCILRRPHVLPASLLQLPVDGSWFGQEIGAPTGDYERVDVDEVESRYRLINEPRIESQPREIIETKVSSAAEGVAQLLQGEIDVLDQLFPSDAARLKSSRDIRVSEYPLPTVHMLIPCSDHPFVAERTFRRALLYGINREDILKGELLEGFQTPGCQVISGPFPAGKERDDPMGYAYDRTIQPRRYEPSVAKLLVALNQNEMKSAAQRAEKEMPEMTPLRLAYPSDNLSRTACEAIKSQWQLLDLDVELVELPTGASYPQEGTADLVYTSLAIWEPIIDARRLLGPDGLAQSGNQYIGLGLRQLEESRNWREARDRLLLLHFYVSQELPILPLWQLIDSYAYRRQIRGIGTDIVSLYENADQWQLQ